MSEKDRQKRIADRIKEARQLSGLSQAQAAKMLEKHRPTISEIENGNRKVSATELAQFAEIYEVSINYLMGAGPDQMNPSDPKLQLAARELSKLSPDALNSLMRALAVIQEDDKDDDSDDGEA
ncbi:helix-turn-helix domain-containing protein [Martelella radicis]|uniref:Transcriptional regulator with XRE-family HTH domain n=1 Tax=Martelella radicis TaxID=1397476 RepID=A0A7W6KNC9_9HYPH|nr:helix-turn-helix transcriptional regulator [Martelella radicis]MBB4124468.1 transcriptional regulator with XRE-family HTH domain [Martelella radicis]